MKSFFPYAKQSITQEDCQAVTQALQSPMITRGPIVEEFEKKIADYCGSRFATVFNSGTSALAACYFAAELGAFDKVISTPNSFIATVASPIHQGIKPQFVDLDRTNGNLNVQLLAPLLKNSLSRGRYFIIPVHFAGIAVDMEALDCQIKDPNTMIIEDAAHALGSHYPTGEKVGSCTYSQMTIFSFHPAKTLTTGEGGAVTTNDPHLHHRLQLYKDNGIERFKPFLLGNEALGYYEAQTVTGNYHMTSFQAALGLSQFTRLENFITKRRLLIKRYRQNLEKYPFIQLFSDVQDEQTAFHLCVVQIHFQLFNITREQLMKDLNQIGIGTQVHYIPLYRHPVLGHQNGQNFPETEGYYSQALSLPLYYELEERDVDFICQKLIKHLKKYQK